VLTATPTARMHADSSTSSSSTMQPDSSPPPPRPSASVDEEKARPPRLKLDTTVPNDGADDDGNVPAKGPRDLATPTEPRPATEEPPLETGSASLPQQPKKAPAPDFPSMFTPTHTQLTVYSLIVFGTIWGVLARLGLQWVGGFASSAVFSLVWAQMVGCAVMGFCVTKKNAIERVCVPLSPPPCPARTHEERERAH